MIPKTSTQYGKLAFWEKRYKENTKQFDWYQKYTGIKDVVTQYITKQSLILNVGCGNSTLSEDMYNEGYKQITNIDFSPTVIQAMQEKYKNYGSDFAYYLMDVRNMRKTTEYSIGLENSTFDCVLDKGCLDSVLSGEYSKVNSTAMLQEIHRVLKDKGVYILISYGLPKYRMPYLDRRDINIDWHVTEYKVYKPNVNVDSVTYDEKDLENYHYIFVCRKGVSSHDTEKRMSVVPSSNY